MSEDQEIIQLLYPKFINSIIFILTYEEVFNVGEHPLTLNQANDFILQNQSEILKIINEMIEDYDVDNRLDMLKNIDDLYVLEYICDVSFEFAEIIRNARY